MKKMNADVVGIGWHCAAEPARCTPVSASAQAARVARQARHEHAPHDALNDAAAPANGPHTCPRHRLA